MRGGPLTRAIGAAATEYFAPTPGDSCRRLARSAFPSAGASPEKAIQFVLQDPDPCVIPVSSGSAGDVPLTNDQAGLRLGQLLEHIQQRKCGLLLETGIIYGKCRYMRLGLSEQLFQDCRIRAQQSVDDSRRKQIGGVLASNFHSLAV